MNTKPTLYLFPTPLGDTAEPLSPAASAVLGQLSDFVAESAKSARRFLKNYPLMKPLQEISITELNEHTKPDQIRALLRPIKEGRSLGVVSDAGCPGVADPGAALVLYAHQQHIPVVPFVGPSSILLALMASGLNGQRFSFSGYLPVDAKERIQTLRTLEHQSRQHQSTQIFIETPYRNHQMLSAILSTCSPDTWLCIAADLTCPTESIRTARIETWRQHTPENYNKRPAVFLLQAAR